VINKLKYLAQVTSKGKVIDVVCYEKKFQEQVMGLFRQGYPISFDGNDLREIRKIVKATDRTFVLAFCEDKLVGCLTGLRKVEGLNKVYVGGYLFVRKEFRRYGIATILLGIDEELLKTKARIIMGVNAGILPDYELSHQWFRSAGGVLLGTVKYWFRADLAGVFMGKVNPHIPLGEEIPKNSNWDPSMSDSITGKRITKRQYDRVINDPGHTPKEKWGLELLRSEGMTIGMTSCMPR